MEKNGIRSKGFVRVVTAVLLLTMMSWLLPVDFMTAKAEAATQIDNPVIKDTSQMEAGQKVTWDCVWFGSYPQSEVVCETDTERINELKNDYYENKYITVSSSTWSKITSAKYNNSGDATIDGVKYKRLEKTDVNYATSGSSNYYYNWGDETVHYFKYEPVKWRVLKVDGNDAFLLADKALDDQCYHRSDTSVTWENCTMRSWLNGYDSSANSYGRDYTKENFINTAFSSSEKNIIKTTDVINDDNINYGTNGGNDTSDKIFLLSENEVSHSNDAFSYGFTKSQSAYDEGRRCQGTTYAKAMGTYSSTSSSYAGNCWWWLRSPGYSSNYAAYVDSDGYVNYYGSSVDYTYNAVRPALHLNISSSNLWSYAGTVKSDGTVNEENSGYNPGIGSDDDTDTGYKPVDEVKPDMNVTSNKVNVFDTVNANASDDKLTKIYPDKFNIKLPVFQAGVKKKTNKDGTYTFTMLLGVGGDTDDLTKKVNSETWMKSFMKDIDKAKDNVAKVSEVNSLLKKYPVSDGKKFDFTSKVSKPEIEAIGYYEMVCDQNGNVISDKGGIIGKFKLDGKVSSPFMLGPVPMYIELGGRLKSSLDMGLENNNATDVLTYVGKFEINPEIFVGAGVGVSGAASIGAEGAGGVQTIISRRSDTAYFDFEGNLKGSVAIKVKLIVVDWDYTVAEKTVPITEAVSSRTLRASRAVIVDSEFSMSDRSYQENTSKWNGGSKFRMFSREKASATEENGITMKELQSYIMPDTIPQMKQIGDDTVMVFQSNDKTRNDANSVKLMYSVFKDGVWSEPAAIYDNGACDTGASLAVAGGKLYVVWQKVKSEVKATEAEAVLKETAVKSEICFAEYDAAKSEFGKPVFVTDNDKLDMMPAISDNSDNLSIMWVQNDSDDFTGITGTKTIYIAECDGSSIAAVEKLGSTTDYISELKGVYNSSDIAVYIASTADSAYADSDVYMIRNGETTKITANVSENDEDIIPSGLNTFGGDIYYSNSGSLMKYDVSSGSSTSVTAGSSNAISANARLIKSGDKTSIIWMENNEDGCSIRTAVKADSGFSEPVDVYQNEELVGSYFTAALDEKGDWQIVLTAKDAAEPDKTSLFFITKESSLKAELTDIIVNEGEIEGTTQPISYSVTNNSETVMTKYTLTITAGNDTLVSKDVTCSIQPGETAYFEDAFDIGSIDETADIKVQTLAENQKDTTDTTVNGSIALADFSISTAKKIAGDAAEFTVTVTNTGKIASGGKVILYGDTEGKREMQSVDFASLAPGESTDVTVKYKASKMIFNEDKAAYCMIKAETGKSEFDESNNIYYGVIYLDELPEDEFNVANYDVTVSDCTYSGTAQKPEVTVVNDGTTLTPDKDYTVSYQDNVNAGIAKVIVKGTGIYSGSKEAEFEINAADISKATVSSIPTQAYNGDVKEPAVTVRMGSTGLKSGRDYIVSYLNNIDAGLAVAVVTGTGNYQGEQKLTFNITPAKISSASLSTKAYTYNGKVKKPSVTVKSGSDKLSGSEYTVTYASGRKNVGKYKVTVKGKGNFTGTKTLYFTIYPKATSISKLTKGKKSFKVNWKKVSSQASGYQIQYATNSKFTKNKKTVTVKSYKTTSKTVTKLKAKKKYYVKIRTYKKVGSTTYYSGWSKYKTVKTR